MASIWLTTDRRPSHAAASGVAGRRRGPRPSGRQPARPWPVGLRPRRRPAFKQIKPFKTMPKQRPQGSASNQDPSSLRHSGQLDQDDVEMGFTISGTNSHRAKTHLEVAVPHLSFLRTPSSVLFALFRTPILAPAEVHTT